MRSRWIPEGGHSTRAGGAWFFTGVVWVIAALLITGALLDWSTRTPAVVLTALTFGHVGWALFGRPRLHVRAEGITVVNPWRTDHVPWSALSNVDTRFQLTLVTRHRTVQVHAAPSPGGVKAIRAAGRPGSDGAAWDHVGQRAGDQVETQSGGAAAVVRGHWRDLVENDVLGEEEPATGGWDTTVVSIAVAGVVLSLLAWVVWAVL